MTKETIIKSTLKYLVKRQIEEGSVGFAVDNDPDHDCCWDDVLAWIEAQSKQPCEEAVSRDVLTEYINTKLTSNEEWASDATNEGRWVEEKTYLYGVEILEDLDEYVKTMPPVTPTSEDIKEAYLKGYDYGVKDWFRSKTQPCDNYISREEAKQFLYERIDRLNDDELYDIFSRIIDDMYNELPPVKPKYTDEEIDKIQEIEQAYVDKMVELAVEETKRPKGKWIKCKSRFGTEYFKCSECGRKLNWIDRDDNYCNSCGSDNSESTKEWFKERDTRLAEMSGGKEDEASN